MNVDALVAAHSERAGWTSTERNWLQALAIAAGCVLLFMAISSLEQIFGSSSREQRLVWNASETSTRFLAIAHTIVATLFLVTSRRMQARGSWLWLLGLLAAGGALCWCFTLMGGRDAPLAGVLFYGYFMAHELRDEVFFYKSNGDLPRDARSGQPLRGMWAAPLLLLGVVLTVMVFLGSFGVGAGARYDEVFDALPLPVRFGIGSAAVGGAVWLLLRTVRGWDRTFAGGWRGLLRAHRPMFVVFTGTFLVLTVGAGLTGRIYGIIGVHVAIWYVFALRQIAKRARTGVAVRPLSWQ
jgi:hypothetical protein